MDLEDVEVRGTSVLRLRPQVSLESSVLDVDRVYSWVSVSDKIKPRHKHLLSLCLEGFVGKKKTCAGK